MSAEIICLAAYRAGRQSRLENGAEHLAIAVGASRAQPASFIENGARFAFWTGASGRRYVHTVYSLFDCPQLEAGNYVLVRRGDRSRREVLAIGRLVNETASLNLAEIRQRAATLGADEVHVHLLASTSMEQQAVEVDLKSAAFTAACN